MAGAQPRRLVITDYKMPGMDGAEFTRRFRAMPNNRHVPLVVITAYDDRSFRLRALDAGATDFLQSPVDHFEIVVRARNLLALGRRMGASGPAAAGGADPEQTPPPAAERPAGIFAGPAADPRRILDAMPAMVSAADREGRCVYANAAFAADAGAAEPARCSGPAAPRCSARSAANAAAARPGGFASGRPVAPYREDAPGPAGRRRLLTSKVPLRDGAGEVVAVLTTSVELPEDAPERRGTARGPPRRRRAGAVP
jgi:CheY-like chemotaxis protein